MWISKARAPSVKMNERVTNIENRLVKVEQHLDNDNQRLKEQEEANRITQQSLLAIMNYLINGGEADKAKLVATRDKLQEYLIGK
jgi:type IV secretory pathway VirB4 component